LNVRTARAPCVPLQAVSRRRLALEIRRRSNDGTEAGIMTILEERVIFITEADREKLGLIVNSEREFLKTDRRNLEALEKE
jgi:hypothetical protein